MIRESTTNNVRHMASIAEKPAVTRTIYRTSNAGNATSSTTIPITLVRPYTSV